jgi:peptidoglycan/LPS O-acetylase OafA/YrhL
MKKGLTIFFQIVIVLIGVSVFAFLIWEPQIEGRNATATLIEIYFKDPFLAYIYLASIPFFVALYQAFKASSQPTTKAFRAIKYCAVSLSILIVMAGVYIRIFHAQDDDPAGFLAICIVTAFISVVIAATAAKFERILQNKEAK